MKSRNEFTPPLRPHDSRCPECHGRDRLDTWCRTCGAEAIDLPRRQECASCTPDGCGGGPMCKHERALYSDNEVDW